MAPKRAAKKAAPPPPPQAESSDETRSGSRSRSRSDESEDEEAIAESPVPAPTPVLKNAPAPSQKGDESESSDDEEDGDEEEEPAPAPPKNQPPPPQKKEASDSSGSGDDEEEEEEEEPTRAAPPSVPKKQPPQPPKKGDSDASGDEGESDEEAPPPKPSPKKEAAALKPPAPAAAAAADETKKPGAFRRIWSTDDEVRILEALAAHQKQHGAFPQPEALVDVLAGKLDNPAYGSKELQSKVTSLRHRYLTLSKRGEAPSKEHDRRVLDLSKIVWDGDKTTPAASGAADDGHEPKGFEEMCELYPYLAEEVKELETRYPGVCKRDFGKLDDDKARAMDEKIKKQRVVQIKVEMRRADLAKEVTKVLVDLVDG